MTIESASLELLLESNDVERTNAAHVLKHLMGERLRLKVEEEELKKSVEHVNEQAALQLAILDVEKVSADGIGTYRQVNELRPSFKKDICIRNLIDAGVAASIVKQAVEGATSYSEIQTVEFRREK